LPKNRFIGLHFRYRQCKFYFNHCDVIGPIFAEFGEITQNNGRYTVQSYLRSSISVQWKDRMRPPTCE